MTPARTEYISYLPFGSLQKISLNRITQGTNRGTRSFMSFYKCYSQNFLARNLHIFHFAYYEYVKHSWCAPCLVVSQAIFNAFTKWMGIQPLLALIAKRVGVEGMSIHTKCKFLRKNFSPALGTFNQYIFPFGTSINIKHTLYYTSPQSQSHTYLPFAMTKSYYNFIEARLRVFYRGPYPRGAREINLYCDSCKIKG